MAETASSGKICIVCGTDVSGRPRVKDAQGRYVCVGECQHKLARQTQPPSKTALPRPQAPAQPRPAVAPAAEPQGMSVSDLLADSPMLKAAACPTCGNLMPQGTVLCLRCGYNAKTGKKTQTKVSVDQAPKEKKVKGKKNPYASSTGMSFGKTFLITTGVLCLVALVAAAGPNAALGSLIIIAICSLVAWIGGIGAAFKNGQSMWGWMGLLQLVPVANVVGTIGFLIYNLIANEDNLSRALYLASMIAAVVWGVAAVLGNGGQPPFAAWGI